MSTDTKAIIGTGIGLATLLLVLIGLMFQQNANLNARIDDVNTSVNARIDDLQEDIRELRSEVRSDIRELRALVIDAIKRTEPAN